MSSLIGLLALAGLASAQENIFRPLPGAKQIGITGNWTSTEGARRYSAIIEGGYYLTESLVGIVRLGLTKQSPENRHILFGGRYEFKAQGISVPYLVAAVEFHSGAREFNSDIVAPPGNPNATFYQAGAGINFFLNTSTSAFLEFVAFKTSGIDDIGTDLQVGIRFFFK